MKNPQLLKIDPWLKPFETEINKRITIFENKLNEINALHGSLTQFANAHHYFGLHKNNSGWTFREWAPNATSIFLIGDCNNWTQNPSYELKRNAKNEWELSLPHAALEHGQRYKLHLTWPGGEGHRLPAYANRVIQDEKTFVYDAQVWAPAEPFAWSDQHRITSYNVCYTKLLRKPGAFTATTFNEPLKRLTTKVANASPSTSSAMITNGRPAFAVASNTGNISFMVEIFLSWIRIIGCSISAAIFSVSVTKYGRNNFV